MTDLTTGVIAVIQLLGKTEEQKNEAISDAKFIDEDNIKLRADLIAAIKETVKFSEMATAAEDRLADQNAAYQKLKKEFDDLKTEKTAAKTIAKLKTDLAEANDRAEQWQKQASHLSKDLETSRGEVHEAAIIIDKLNKGEKPEEKPINTIGEIDVETLTGKLLGAAIAVLTTSPHILIQGQKRNGVSMTPDCILTELNDLAVIMYKKDK